MLSDFPTLPMSGLPEPKREVLPFSPVENETFHELENVRLQNNGPHIFYQPRKGSTHQRTLPATVTSSIHCDVLIGGTLAPRIIIGLSDNTLRLWDPVGDTLTTVLDAQTDATLTFTATDIEIAVNGNWIYLHALPSRTTYALHAERAKAYPWNGTNSRSITGGNWISTGDNGYTGTFESGSIFDFRSGKSVFYFPKLNTDASDVIKQAITRIEENNLYTVIAGEEKKIEGAYPYKTGFSELQDLEVVAGDRTARAQLEIRTAFNDLIIASPAQNYTGSLGFGAASISFSYDSHDDSNELAGIIKAAFDADALATAWTCSIELGTSTDQYGKVVSAWITFERNTVNIDDGITVNITPGGASPLSFATTTTELVYAYILENEWGFPRIARSYILIDVLEDGSYTIPSKPFLIDTQAFELVERAYQGIRLTFPAETGTRMVAKRLLFATPFLFEKATTVLPTTIDYPNGAYYFVTELTTEATEYIDTTPDDALQLPLSSYIPLAGGVSSQFGANQLTPHHIRGLQNTVLIGGYTIERIEPSFSTNVHIGPLHIERLGSTQANEYICVRFVYADGTTSTLIRDQTERQTDSLYTLFSLPSYVQHIEFFTTVNPLTTNGNGDPQMRFCKRIHLSDPEAHGLPFTLPEATGTDEFHDADKETTTVELASYLSYAIPGQQLSLSAQLPLPNRASITQIIPLRFDDERSSLRYTLAVFTDRDIQLAYISDTLTLSDLVVEQLSDQIVAYSPQEWVVHEGTLYFQSNYGIVGLTGRTPQRLHSRSRYPDLSNSPIQSMVFWEEENELWIETASGTIYLYDLDAQGFKRYKYPNEVHGRLHSWDAKLYRVGGTLISALENQDTGKDTLADSSNASITFRLQTTPLSPIGTVQRLQSVRIWKQACTFFLNLDLGRAFFDPPSAFTSGFSSSLSIENTTETSELYGVELPIHQRGQAIRLRLNGTALNAFTRIARIETKGILTTTEGRGVTL